MFEVPDAKRVKRSEIFEAESRDESEVEDDSAQPLSYKLEYEIVENVHISKDAEKQEDKDDGFAFNLFRPQSTMANVVKIRSPSVVPEAEPGLSVSRPDSYYFTGQVSQHKRDGQVSNFAAAAITNAQLHSLARQAWPGMAVPWRVLTLPAHRRQIVIHKSGNEVKIPKEPSTTVVTKRARPSKKKRDMLRAKDVKKQRIIDETKTKEEHEREKKNKKNRERKLKRRAKERKEKEERRKSGGTGPHGSDTD